MATSLDRLERKEPLPYRMKQYGAVLLMVSGRLIPTYQADSWDLNGRGVKLTLLESFG